jgi:hypothetical protein
MHDANMKITDFCVYLVDFKPAQEKTRDTEMNSSIHSGNPSYILFKIYSFDLVISLQNN